jgi:hypothetical protein
MFWYSDQSCAKASPHAASTSATTNETVRMTNALLDDAELISGEILP